jgi:hypothetical protein
LTTSTAPDSAGSGFDPLGAHQPTELATDTAILVMGHPGGAHSGCACSLRPPTIAGMEPGAVLRSRFPNAMGGVRAGSTARGEATASSDLDLVVLLAGPPAPMRRTERVDGQLVEFFVHTESSFHAFVERERAQRRSPLLHMVAHGRIVGDHGGLATRVQEAARALWSAGPPVPAYAEIEARRYRLTALLPTSPRRTTRPRGQPSRPVSCSTSPTSRWPREVTGPEPDVG